MFLRFNFDMLYMPDRCVGNVISKLHNLLQNVNV